MSETPAAIKAPITASTGPELAAFWRRLLALVLDWLLLDIVGRVLGASFGGVFPRLGPWGRLVGFGVAMLYFVLLDGPPGGGRTLGKRALGIRVLNERGEPPGWRAASMRASFLALCFALNNNVVFGHWSNPRVMAIDVYNLAVQVTLYLTLFERRRRQGLHDIAAGTFVAREGKPWSAPGERNPVHAVVLLVLLVIGGAGAWLITGSILKPLLDVSQAVTDATRLDVIGVNQDTTYMKGGATRSVSVSVMVYEDPGETALRDGLRRVANAVFSSGVPLDTFDRLSINILTGYNIGIAASTRSHSVVLPPAQWRAWLSGASPGPFPLPPPAAASPSVPANQFAAGSSSATAPVTATTGTPPGNAVSVAASSSTIDAASVEARNRSGLESLRSALKAFQRDRHIFPPNLSSLVDSGYLKEIPANTILGLHPESNMVHNLSSLDDNSAGDTGGWGYVNNPRDKDFGNVFLNCGHADSAGRHWDSY